MTQIDQVCETLRSAGKPELAEYARECFDSLDEVVNRYMVGFPNSIAVDDCLVRGAAVLCDIHPKTP